MSQWQKNPNIRFSDLNFHGVISSKETPPIRRTRLMDWLEQELKRMDNLLLITETEYKNIWLFLIPISTYGKGIAPLSFDEFQLKVKQEREHIIGMLQAETEWANPK